MGNFFKNITVEPCILFFIIVQDWMKELDANLFLQKACRFNLTTEPDLNTKCDDEKQGILFVSEFFSSYGFAVSFLNMFVLIFASIWSDESGRRRRPLIMIPIFGIILHSSSGFLNSYFWHWAPSIAVVSWAVIRSFCADAYFLMPFCQMYICDISDSENRTMRLGFVSAIRMVGILLGRGGTGFILRSIGFTYFYVLCFTLSVISLACCLIFIKDRSVPVEKKIPFCRMFSLRRILLIDSFKVVFKRKLGKKRVIVLLLMLINLLNAFAIHGEFSMLYLYLRHRFKFDERMFSAYMFCKFSFIAVGVVFCSLVLSKSLKIHDGIIGMLATFCDTLAATVLLSATKIWHLYSVNLLDIFHGVVLMVSVSFMSKYYISNELGRLNAVNSAFQLLAPISLPVYNKIFQKTLDTFPSAFCVLSIVLNFSIFLFFIGCYSLSRKFVKKVPVAKEEESMVASTDIK